MKMQIRSFEAKRMKRNGVTVLCAALLVSGCAAQTHFVDEHPVEPLKTKGAAVFVAVVPVIEAREGNAAIGSVYSGKPTEDVPTIIQQELMSTGLFEDVRVFRVVLTKDRLQGGDRD